jgi:transcriptional regulator with XRE-family HTH domain
MRTMWKHSHAMNSVPEDVDFLARILAMPEMSRRLAAARMRAGYRSQRAFADALGVSHGLVGQWETGHKEPGRHNLANIAKLCGISMDYLQGTQAEMTRSLVVSVEQEAQLILLFRRMPPVARENLLKLLSVWGDRPHVTEKKRQPA